jgi:hypothetical protein
LSLAVRDRLDGPEPAPASNARQQQVSKLLPLLFDNLDTTGRLTVLDLGRALPETLDFFSQFRCKIHVVDLYGELQSGRVDQGSNNKTLQRQFQELFAFEPGTCLDICFLWDLLHYLDEKLLRAFSSALWPWLTAKSVAHGFGVHSAATILLNREYGIFDTQSLSVRQRAQAQLKNSPHPQSFMNEWLTCFAAGSGVLLPDGKVETLFYSTI